MVLSESLFTREAHQMLRAIWQRWAHGATLATALAVGSGVLAIDGAPSEARADGWQAAGSRSGYPVAQSEMRVTARPEARYQPLTERLPSTQTTARPATSTRPAGAAPVQDRAVVHASATMPSQYSGSARPNNNPQGGVVRAGGFDWSPEMERSASQVRRTAHVAPFAEDETILTPRPEGSPHSMSPHGAYEGTPDQGGFDYGYGGPEMGYPAMGGGEMTFDDGALGGFFTPWADGDCCGTEGLDPMLFERFPACSMLAFLNELSLQAGVQAFKGPIDQGRNGNFGFHQAIGTADTLWHRMGVGYQLGARVVESNFSGSEATGVTDRGTRVQTFVTGGFFHRAFYNRGLQYGIVADYLNDNYFDNMNMVQLRWEVSYLNRRGGEFGVWGTGSTQNSEFVLNGVPMLAKPINQTAFFYRKNTNSGGFCRMWAGFTDTNSATFGGDMRMVFSNRWESQSGFNYMIPTGSGTGPESESWGLSFNLVWYPGRLRQAPGPHIQPYRPLFNIADNSIFMVDQAVQ